MPATIGHENAMAAIIAAALLMCSGPWTTVQVTESARILAVEPIGGKSHWNFISGVIRTLLDHGHHVTAFTPFADGDQRRGNYTEVDISDVVPTIRDANLEELVRNWSMPFGLAGQFVELSRVLCDRIYEKPEMKRLLQRPTDVPGQGSSSLDFDIVLIEPFMSECLTYVAARLQVPMIYAVPTSTVGVMERLSTGHFSNPAVESQVMAHYALPNTFVRRLTNTAIFVYFEVARAYRDLLLKFTDPKPFDSVASVSPSLIFVNGHYICNPPTATSAEVINVGGIHLKPAANSLPEVILEFIERSPNGVIYFSFGSTVKISTLPEHLKKAFIGALAQVPQRVLLKYEEDDMNEKPKNVMVAKWFPQREILLHPNVKLFISHGGISGLYEAVDAGVPVLGFPLFADQPRNIDSLVNNGMAISMDLLTVTEETFLNNVLEILNDEKYTKNAKTASEIFKDRPLSPAEQVVYWTEYVIRHKGAPHLKSHALNLTWYQYYLLDVIAAFLILIFVLFFIVYKFLKSIYKLVFNLLRTVKEKSE